MPGELSFQQAAQPELHDNPDTSVVWVKVAIVTKVTGRYSFIVLRTPASATATEGGSRTRYEDHLLVFALTRLPCSFVDRSRPLGSEKLLYCDRERCFAPEFKLCWPLYQCEGERSWQKSRYLHTLGRVLSRVILVASIFYNRCSSDSEVSELRACLFASLSV